MLRIGGLALVVLVSLAPCARAQASDARAAHDLARGTTLTAGDIVVDSGAAPTPSLPLGWVTRRIVHTGELLHAPAIAPPQLVRAGTNVTISAATGAVIASREGIAMSGGALGEQVHVRLDARRTITGTVAGPASVRIP